MPGRRPQRLQAGRAHPAPARRNAWLRADSFPAWKGRSPLPWHHRGPLRAPTLAGKSPPLIRALSFRPAGVGNQSRKAVENPPTQAPARIRRDTGRHGWAAPFKKGRRRPRVNPSRVMAGHHPHRRSRRPAPGASVPSKSLVRNWFCEARAQSPVETEIQRLFEVDLRHGHQEGPCEHKAKSRRRPCIAKPRGPGSRAGPNNARQRPSGRSLAGTFASRP